MKPATEPGKLRQALNGVRLMGVRKSIQVLVSTGQTMWWDRRFAPRPPDWRSLGQTPGRLRARIELDSGSGFTAQFDHAELEVRFLARDLVRVTWHPGLDPVPYAIARRDWPPVDEPEITVDLADDGALTFRTLDASVLRRDLPPTRHGTGWRHLAVLHEDEQVHGLGERALPFDLRGHTCAMWNAEPGGHYSVGHDPIYLCVPTYVGVHSDGSYLVFYENSHRAWFSFDENLDARFEGGALRYYVVPGPLPRALERYSELTGRPPLPPKWSLGYHQSRWGYPSADDIRAVAAGFRHYDLPLSAIHLDIEYMDRYRVFTVDQQDFPDLPGLAGELACDGVRLVTIVDPAVAKHRGYRLYDEGVAGGRFCRLSNGRTVHGVVWPGWAALPDFSDPSVRAWWGSQYRSLLDAGASGFWHDMNEPTTFTVAGGARPPLGTRHAMDGRGGDHVEARNLYALLMAQAAHEGLTAARADRRPFLFSRSGWAGLQRYAWTWTGDTRSTWPMLRQTVATVLGLSLSGIPFSGPDIGGYRGEPSEELYLRWLQLATFLPLFRTHSSYETPPREPWAAAPNHLDAVRTQLRLRYRLLPYLYTLAWDASQTGHPLLRPLFWFDEGDQRLRAADDSFLLGDDLLVAPVLDEGARSRRVPLPTGSWYPLDGAEPVEGGQDLDVPAPIDHTPVFVRTGAVIPMDEDGELALHLYAPPEGGTGRGVLYQDAGDGYGPWRVDRFTVTRDGDTLSLDTTSEGDYPTATVRTTVHGPARLL
jgi:alpha-glucosidase